MLGDYYKEIEMSIRVLHVVTYMGRGGLETMIMNYYRQIDRNEIQFDFLVHRDFEADYDSEIISLGGNIYHMPALNPFSPKYYRSLCDFFSTHQYDIVHSHLDCLSAYPLSVAQKYGVKNRIAHAHNKNQDRNLKYPIKMLSKVMIPYFATQLFACSDEAGKWMFRGRDFAVMRNAIDSRKFLYSPEKEQDMKRKFGIENKFVIGHIGRFNPQKNHKFLVKIFEKVLKKDPEAVLLLIGSGDGQKEIETQVRTLGIENSVMFLGSRDDIPALLQGVDVFVFPSLYEGLGIAAVEAQAAGVPCILSEEVPRECKLCENVEFLSLEDPDDVWADHICQHKFDMKTDNINSICDQGYDIVRNVEWLQKFYMSMGKKK